MRRALIVLAAVIAAATLNNVNVKATPLDDSTITNAPAICAQLDANSTETTVENVIGSLGAKGFTGEQAGEIVARSVVGWCPRNIAPVQAFAAKWGTNKPVRA